MPSNVDSRRAETHSTNGISRGVTGASPVAACMLYVAACLATEPSRWPIDDRSPIACGRDLETQEFPTMPSCSLTAMGDQRDWIAIDGCPDLRVDERQVPRLRGPRK